MVGATVDLYCEDYWKKPFYLKLWMMHARVRQFQKVFLEAKNPKYKEIDPENWRPKSQGRESKQS